jgi:phosphoribosyl 1,2-cyclic phosphate phosphodiesterase
MALITVEFLGTGTSQGVPVIACNCNVCLSLNPKDSRLRTSVKITVNNKVFVVDSGPDFRQQMLRSKTKQLDALLFTHEHKDHIAGMDDIRAFNYVSKQAVHIYATNRVQDALKREFAYVFSDEKYPGIPEVEIHTIHKDADFLVDTITVRPIEVFHYKLPVLGFRIGDFAYITDANKIEVKELEKLKNVKVLVLNALRREKHISHFTLQEAIEMGRLIGAEKTYFTHLSHQMGLHDEVNLELPNGFEVAYDTLQISI